VLKYRELDRSPGVLPLYTQIANDLQAMIEAGEIVYKVPSESELMDGYGVARQTARQAMQVLKDRGVVVAQKGFGTYVKR
jgi:DNA-binding GntR family transcriptional regulator